MKTIFKTLAIVVTFITLTSCKNEQETLISNCETELIKNLRDPNSYEKIEVQIVDSITNLENAEKLVKIHEFEYNLEKESYESFKRFDNGYFKDKFQKVEKEHKELIKNADYIRKTKEANDIKEILVSIKYRTNNSMGALEIYDSYVVYFPNETDDNKKYNIHKLPK